MIDKTEYARHPLSEVWGDMEQQDFRALVADIKANGVIEPVVLHQDMVLDGWHRYRASLEAGLGDPAFDLYEGNDATGYVISRNRHRRHQTKAQTAAVVVMLRKDQLARHGGDRRSDQTAAAAVWSTENLALEAGCSPRMVEEVRRAVREGHGPALVSGKTTLREIAKNRKLDADPRYAPRKPVAHKPRKGETLNEAGKRSLADMGATEAAETPDPARDVPAAAEDPVIEVSLSEWQGVQDKLALAEQENMSLRMAVDEAPPSDEEDEAVKLSRDALQADNADLKQSTIRQRKALTLKDAEIESLRAEKATLLKRIKELENALAALEGPEDGEEIPF